MREQGKESGSERAKTEWEREKRGSVGMREERKSGCERGEIVWGREREREEGERVWE